MQVGSVWVVVEDAINCVLRIALVSGRLPAPIESDLESRRTLSEVIRCYSAAQVVHSLLVHQSRCQQWSLIRTQNIFAVSLFIISGWYNFGFARYYSAGLEVIGIACSEIAPFNTTRSEEGRGRNDGLGHVADGDSVVAINCAYSVLIVESSFLVDADPECSPEFMQHGW